MLSKLIVVITPLKTRLFSVETSSLMNGFLDFPPIFMILLCKITLTYLTPLFHLNLFLQINPHPSIGTFLSSTTLEPPSTPSPIPNPSVEFSWFSDSDIPLLPHKPEIPYDLPPTIIPSILHPPTLLKVLKEIHLGLDNFLRNILPIF
jgi:hypothetical protein